MSLLHKCHCVQNVTVADLPLCHQFVTVAKISQAVAKKSHNLYECMQWYTQPMITCEKWNVWQKSHTRPPQWKYGPPQWKLGIDPLSGNMA